MKKMLLTIPVMLVMFFSSSLAWANHPDLFTPEKKVGAQLIESSNSEKNIPCYYDQREGMLCKIDGEWETPTLKESWKIQSLPVIMRGEIVAYDIYAYNNQTKETIIIASDVKIIQPQWRKIIQSLNRTGVAFGGFIHSIFWLPASIL